MKSGGLILFSFILLCLCAIFCGCVAIRPPLHFISVANNGTAKISNVKIKYGPERIEFPSMFPPRGMVRAYEAAMDVPEEMLVTWTTADNRQRVKLVPLRLVGVNARSLSALRIIFRDENLDVEQGVRKDGLTNNPIFYAKIFSSQE